MMNITCGSRANGGKDGDLWYAVCDLPNGHPGPHENSYCEWWGDGPLVRKYGESTSVKLFNLRQL